MAEAALCCADACVRLVDVSQPLGDSSTIATVTTGMDHQSSLNKNRLSSQVLVENSIMPSVDDGSTILTVTAGMDHQLGLKEHSLSSSNEINSEHVFLSEIQSDFFTCELLNANAYVQSQLNSDFFEGCNAIMATEPRILTLHTDVNYESLNLSCISDIIGEANRDLYHDSSLVDSFVEMPDSFNADLGQTFNDISSNSADYSDLSDFALDSTIQPTTSIDLCTLAEGAPSIGAPTGSPSTGREKIVLILTRKRNRNEELWECSLRKKKRQAGLEYINSKGKVIPALCGAPKSLKNCLNKCKFRCAEKISDTTRHQVHLDCWQHSDDGKSFFYAQTVEKLKKNRENWE